MTAFRAFRHRRARRPDDGKFLPKDVKVWRALLFAARYQARAPLAATDKLEVAVARAKLAVLPPAERHRGSSFMRLISLCRGWAAMPERERHERAGELALLCDACEPPLRTDPAPGRPPRADIFG